MGNRMRCRIYSASAPRCKSAYDAQQCNKRSLADDAHMITRSPRYQDRVATRLSAAGRYSIADRALRIFC
jgi:hypothetical protein